MKTYEVIGAGSSDTNRIITSASCDDTLVTICWIGRTIYKEECEESFDDERYCETLTITPSSGDIISSTTWNELPVYYTIKRECPDPPEPSCKMECSEFSVYPVPKYITDDDENVEIHYQYYLTDICDKDKETESIKSRVRKTGVETKKISEFFECDEDGKCVGEYQIGDYNTCSDDVTVFKTEPTACTTSCRADITITFSQKVIPSTGATINVIVSFKKTMTDDECHKTTKTGSFILPWEIPECEKSGDEDFHCCEDHYVTSSITISDLIAKAKLTDCSIYYNGKPVTTDSISYAVLQKAKYTDECEHYCTPETTYCADQKSVKVCYETSYMSDEWICEGEGSDTCDCNGLVIEGSAGSMSVPFTGGRIKVTWNYTGETTTPDCSKYTTSGTWEEIILVGGCDERPIDCKDEYKGEDGHAEDCEICDAECCYNYDGEGNCRCVIYFKKRMPSCGYECEESPLYYYFPSIDDTMLFKTVEEALEFAHNHGKTEEEALALMKEITFNLIRYEFNQDCTPICDYVKTYRYDKKVYELPCEFEGGTSYTVEYSAVTEYIGAGCPPPVVMPYTSAVTLVDITKNDTPGDKIIIDSEMIKVVQKPCWSPPSTCTCDDLILEGGDDPGACKYLRLSDPVVATFNVNGHTSDFAETVNTNETTTYSVNLSYSAGFTIGGDGGATIDNKTAGTLEAGTHTISFPAVGVGVIKNGTISFSHEGTTIKLTLMITNESIGDNIKIVIRNFMNEDAYLNGKLTVYLSDSKNQAVPVNDPFGIDTHLVEPDYQDDYSHWVANHIKVPKKNGSTPGIYEKVLAWKSDWNSAIGKYFCSSGSSVFEGATPYHAGGNPAIKLASAVKDPAKVDPSYGKSDGYYGGVTSAGGMVLIVPLPRNSANGTDPTFNKGKTYYFDINDKNNGGYEYPIVSSNVPSHPMAKYYYPVLHQSSSDFPKRLNTPSPAPALGDKVKFKYADGKCCEATYISYVDSQTHETKYKWDGTSFNQTC